MEWTPEAEARLQKAPRLLRRMIRRKVESAVKASGGSLVTEAALDRGKKAHQETECTQDQDCATCAERFEHNPELYGKKAKQ